MVVGYVTIEPIFSAILTFLAFGVQWLMDLNLIPFLSFFVQPAQLLFLNNAINHGIMVPIGLEQASELGKSVLFLVEANGGTWLGLLLAFTLFGRGMAKKSAPAASFIMFAGGIGEIAFPYALIKPITVLGPILGNVAALFILLMFDGGTVAAVSPGSFFALLAMTPKGTFLVNITAYVVATLVSFLVVAFFLKNDKTKEIIVDEQIETDSAADTIKEQQTEKFEEPAITSHKKINNVVIACDAGMGSSAMGLSILRTKAKKAMLDLEINNCSIDHIPSDADVVITNAVLEDRVRAKLNDPSVPIFVMKNFLNNDEYDRILETIKKHQ